MARNAYFRPSSLQKAMLCAFCFSKECVACSRRLRQQETQCGEYAKGEDVACREAEHAVQCPALPYLHHFAPGEVMREQVEENYKDTGKETSYIEMTTVVEENRIWLQIKDNGFGAEEAEIPFLPDKGFTGKTVMGQAKATGMGLYLVAQMAKDLSLCVDIESKVGESFIIRIGFPVISR